MKKYDIKKELKKLSPRMILTLTLVGIIIIFSIQNSETINLNIFFWKVSVPRILLIMGSLTIGVFIGLMFPSKKE